MTASATVGLSAPPARAASARRHGAPGGADRSNYAIMHQKYDWLRHLRALLERSELLVLGQSRPCHSYMHIVN